MTLNLTKHEAKYKTNRTPMGELEYLTNLWDEICWEQERNDYDWEKTKKAWLSNWNSYETMSLDYWMAYMQESILWAAKEVVHQSKKSTSEPQY